MTTAEVLGMVCAGILSLCYLVAVIFWILTDSPGEDDGPNFEG